MYVCKASAGTGKTYTLAAHYIALLMNNVPSRNILAVTFTNKATEEMKQRIITYLNAIAYHPDIEETIHFLDAVRDVSIHVRHLSGFTNEQYQAKAVLLLKDIMAHFDDLSISTIDSFLQTLLAGMVQAIGQIAGFGVDLDLKHAISTAIDEVLSVDVAEYDDIQKAVENCLNQRLNNEDKWDLRPGLIKLVEQLYKEDVQQNRDCIPLVSADHPHYEQLVNTYAQSLDSFIHEQPYQDFVKAYQTIQPYELALSQGTGATNYSSFFKKCANVLALSGTEEAHLGDNDLYRLINHPQKLPLLQPYELQLLFDQITLINSISNTIWRSMIRRKLFREHLSNLLLAGYVIERIERDQKENNTFLLAKTAYTLCTALDKHDAQFILMKAGIRYRHIMLDEFQDTSTLQWENFRWLLEEILSEGDGTALIVGDTKQSIYRWRNGDYEIMNGLDKPQKDSTLHTRYTELRLPRNFRSRKQIVNFNLTTFKSISEKESVEIPELRDMYNENFVPGDEANLNKFYNAGSKEGGYVCLRQYEDQEDILQFMFTQMEALLDAYQPKDMLILCRTAKEAKRVLKTFNQIKNDPAFPHLTKAEKIISGDSFLLESSKAVNTIICALKMLVRLDPVARQYILINHPSVDINALEALSITLPFTDLVEHIIRLTLCSSGIYTGQDIAHLNCLRDKIRGYISKYGSNLEDFLQYWDDKMHTDAIPATDSNHIRIMTIHAAKGLQAKNVFIPFCAWKKEEDGNTKSTLWCDVPQLNLDKGQALLPVSFGRNMKEISELKDTYEAERKKQHVDALNLLYVACTRAEDNLFLLVYKSPQTANAAGRWLTDLYGESYATDEGGFYRPTAQLQKEHIPEPFSFEKADTIEAKYTCSSANIQFRQSHSTTQLMRHIDQIDDNIDNINFGNMCHAILEHILTANDVDRVIDDFFLRGVIPSQSCKKHVRSLIDRLMHHPVAGEWFDGSWQLMREDSVLAWHKEPNRGEEQLKEFRMDRVMIRNNQVVVLDYKFARKDSEHVAQVTNYMSIMRNMGYTSVRGYLWYGFQNELIPV